MSTPHVPPNLDDPQADDAPPVLVTKADDVARLEHLLVWMRQNRFTASTIQLGDLTLQGVVDHLPRSGPSSGRGDEREVLDVPPWYEEASPRLAEELRKAEGG